jgi:serine phosphatase RsbU (regulator of sigma subunit)
MDNEIENQAVQNKLPVEDYRRQKKELTESLRYASYIQKALLPSPSLIKKIIPEHFILHLPCDIVSGDFYYVTRRKNEIIIAVADCTGHGVPGAFMSILGITILKEVINKNYVSTAASILNQIREHVMEALSQTGEDTEQKDGLDMALCSINTENNNLQFAGAFNPVYIIHNNKLLEIQGDRMPIGIAPDEEKSFTNHQYTLEENDLIYLFTDGFVDQFGGPYGKKFKYQQFRNLLLNISLLPVHKQKEQVLDTFQNWKGNLKQLDDVLIIGWRYHKSS